MQFLRLFAKGSFFSLITFWKSKKYSLNIHKLLQLFDSTIMNLHETRTKGRGIFYKPITCCNIFTIVQIIRHFFIFLFFSNSLIKDVLFSFNILTAETIGPIFNVHVMVVNILYNHWCSFMVSFNHRKKEKVSFISKPTRYIYMYIPVILWKCCYQSL